MPHITGFSVRSSGRDLNAVRRPVRAVAASLVKDATSVEVEPVVLEPEELTKPDLANLAVAVGVEPSGTKAEVAKRVKKKTDG
jgi:hypothetical protein